MLLRNPDALQQELASWSDDRLAGAYLAALMVQLGLPIPSGTLRLAREKHGDHVTELQIRQATAKLLPYITAEVDRRHMSPN